MSHQPTDDNRTRANMIDSFASCGPRCYFDRRPAPAVCGEGRAWCDHAMRINADTDPAEAARILAELHEATRRDAPQFDMPFTLAGGHAPRPAPKARGLFEYECIECGEPGAADICERHCARCAGDGTKCQECA